MISVLKAIQIATLAHHGQVRKYSDNVPYIIHPLRVMARLEEYLAVSPRAHIISSLKERLLIVAALHDVLEDTQYPPEQISAEFGREVLEDVNLLTNPSKKFPDRPREERKAMDRSALSICPVRLKVIKMIDRIDNLYDMREGKKKFVVDVYLPESRLLRDAIADADPALAGELTRAMDWLKGQFNEEKA